MKFAATIKIKGDVKGLVKALEPDNDSTKSDRSNQIIKKGKESITVEIEAKDPVALRAALNSISKLLIVHEKMKGI
ncbi:MAG: KEOPS complex subunit Pcc1 [Candidatus Woesearchaeota archaeon]